MKEILDGDYNAIEARAVCWLAGEDGILQLWREGKDLYKVMASHAYGVPVSRIDSDQREVGKRLELGCFGKDTAVLTSRGLKPIWEINCEDWLWDGLDWVQSEGAIYQGCKKTLSLEGVHVTPDHLVSCGQTWNPAQVVAQNEGLLLLALDNASASLLSRVLKLGSVGEFCFTESNVHVEGGTTMFSSTTSIKGQPRDASDAPEFSKQKLGNITGDTQTSSPTTPPESGCSIGFLRALAAAIVPPVRAILTTEEGAYVSGLLGGKTDANFFATSFVYPGTRTPNWNSTVATLIWDTAQGTCASPHEAKTCRTVAPLLNFNRSSKTCEPVFDVLNAGPRSRFTIWTARGPLIVHNCGYQMGPDKFQSTSLEMYQLDLPYDLCKRGVEVYRATHPKVVRYWYYLDAQATAAIKCPGKQCGPFIVRKAAGLPYLLFKLKSGRSLAYPHPMIEPDPEFGEQITYWGQLPLSTRWGRIKLYGGKLTENETQATAADIMAHGAIVAEARGMAPFALIHDQALAERLDGKTPEEFAAALGDLPVWAKGLPLKVEAKIAPYYRK